MEEGSNLKLYFYRGREPNFGDELNTWLMPRVLPSLLDDNPDDLLLAIGSVLFDHHPDASRKIVLGSGYGGYTCLPTLDSKWDIRCVRGPITAHVLNLPSSKVAGDAAILLRRHYRPATDKRVFVSFIPHFESVNRGHWRQACELADIRFIDPRLPVDEVLEMISESSLVMAEAMHGAIVSDALRIPWIAIRPVDPSHHMKWNDWAGALGFTVRFQDIVPSSMAEFRMAKHGSGSGGRRLPHKVRRVIETPLDMIAMVRAAISLRTAAGASPQLSSDKAIEAATQRLEAAASDLLDDYRVNV